MAAWPFRSIRPMSVGYQAANHRALRVAEVISMPECSVGGSGGTWPIRANLAWPNSAMPDAPYLRFPVCHDNSSYSDHTPGRPRERADGRVERRLRLRH